MIKCSQSRGVTPPTLMCLPRRISCPTSGVINIVVCGVAARDILKGKLSDKADHAGIARLQRPVCPFVHRPKFADEGFYNYQGGVEHVSQSHCTDEGSPMIQSL